MIRIKIIIKDLNEILSKVEIITKYDNINPILFKNLSYCNDILRKHKEIDINIQMIYEK